MKEKLTDVVSSAAQVSLRQLIIKKSNTRNVLKQFKFPMRDKKLDSKLPKMCFVGGRKHE